MLSPILYWTDANVWEFIRSRDIPYCKLYDEGWKRLGCICCPMNRRKEDQCKRWPLYERNWRRAAHRFWDMAQAQDRDRRSLRTFKDADEWFDWWLSNKSMPKEDDCQMGLF